MSDYLQELYELISWAESITNRMVPRRVIMISLPFNKYYKIRKQAALEYLFYNLDGSLDFFGIRVKGHHERYFEGTEIITES